jgi:hypothetical protein
MLRSDYSITVCLIFLGLVIMVRTVAIAQHACGVLRPPRSCDYWMPAVAAVASGHADGPTGSSSAESPAPITARPVISVPSVINAPSGEDLGPAAAAKNPSEVAAFPAQNQIQVVSEKKRKRMASIKLLRRHYEASSGPKNVYSYRSNDSRFKNTWRAVIW